MSDTIENKAVKLSDLTSVTQLIKDYTDEKDTNKVDKIEGKSLLDDTEIERLKGVNNYDDTEVKENIAEVKTDVTKLSSQIDENVNLINARMDTFTKLEEGSTTADAELKDIRVGANGTTYENAGNAVREQFCKLKEDLDDKIQIEKVNLAKEVYQGKYLSKLMVGTKYPNVLETNMSENSGVCMCNLIDVKQNDVYYFWSNVTGEMLPISSTSIGVFDADMTYLGVLENGSSVTVSYEGSKYLYLRFAVTYSGTLYVTKDATTPTEEYTSDGTLLLRGKKPAYKEDIEQIREVKSKGEWYGKTWLTYGDSITAHGNNPLADGDISVPEVGWQPYVSQHYGFAKHYGMGIGGKTFCWNNKVWFANSDGSLNSRNDTLNVSDVTSDDIPEGCTAHYGAFCSWDRIKTMIPDSVKDTIDLIFVMGGTNDFLGYKEIGDTSFESTNTVDEEWANSTEKEFDGDYNINTFKGAIASTVMKLQKRCPNALIVLATPLNGYTGVKNANKTELVKNSYTEQDYANAIIEVAQMFGIPCVDVFGTCGINVLNSSQYIADGTHPSIMDGRKMLARAVIGGLKNIYPMLV